MKSLRKRPRAGVPEKAVAASSPRPVFSQDLRNLTHRFAGRPVSVGELLAATKGRGSSLLLLLIALPFVSPLPLPGFSIPFGAAVAVVGARLALNRRLWLPARLLHKELPPRFLERVLRTTSHIVRAVEFFLRSRLVFVNDSFVFQRMAGFLITVSGFYMALPFPLPFSNSLPAWTVLLLAAGSLGRDGLFFILGCVSFIVSTAFFVAVAFGGAEAWQWLNHARTAALSAN